MFFVEQDTGHNDFDSIPACLWWCVQTFTTVGYGDVIPHTFGGRLFAACFMLLGAVTISLPILTIVSEFVRLYPKNVELMANSTDDNKGGHCANGNKVNLPLRPLKPIKRISTARLR